MGDDNYYRLPEDFALKLLRLKKDYYSQNGIDLDNARQPSGFSMLFGAKDVTARWNQCLLFQQFIYGLQLHLPIPHSIQHPGTAAPETAPAGLDEATWRTHCHVLIAVCLFIDSSLKNIIFTASMEGLIKAAMGVNPANELDDATCATCFETALLHLTGPLLGTINKNLAELQIEELKEDGSKKHLRIPPMSEKTFTEVLDFVQKESAELKKLLSARKYPVTNLLMPTLAVPLRVIMGSGGVLIGHIAVNTTKAMPLHSSIAAGITSIALVAVPSAGKGMMIVAAPYATITAAAVFGITGYQTGKALGELAAQGLGFFIGVPCDTGIRLIKHMLHMAKLNAYHKEHGKKPNPGYSIMDGSFVAADYVKAMPDTSAPDILSPSSSSMPPPVADLTESRMEIDEASKSLTFNIAGETVSLPYTSFASMDSSEAAPYMEQLRAVLAERGETPEMQLPSTDYACSSSSSSMASSM